MMTDKSNKRPFKVWNVNRSQKHSVVVSSLSELLDKGHKKLGIDTSEVVRVVLEEDGTLVEDEDYFQLGLKPNDTLMLLRHTEAWSKEPSPTDDVLDGNEMDGPEMDGPGDMLRFLAIKLKSDMKAIFLLNNSEYEAIANADSTELSALMCTSVAEVSRIQSTCQRLLDEQRDYDDVKNLVELLHRQTDKSTETVAQEAQSKRKRKN